MHHCHTHTRGFTMVFAERKKRPNQGTQRPRATHGTVKPRRVYLPSCTATGLRMAFSLHHKHVSTSSRQEGTRIACMQTRANCCTHDSKARPLTRYVAQPDAVLMHCHNSYACSMQCNRSLRLAAASADVLCSLAAILCRNKCLEGAKCSGDHC